MGHARAGKANKQGTKTHAKAPVRGSGAKRADHVDAIAWVNAEWVRLVGDEHLTRLERTKIALIGDPEKRERIRALAIRSASGRLTEKRRADLYDKIFAGMPRRMRRALGERTLTGMGLGSMAVPLSSAGRRRSVDAARERGDGPGMTNPHGYDEDA